VGDTWNTSTALTWVDVSDDIDLNPDLTLDVSLVNMSSAGTYTITYYAEDSSGNVGTLNVQITVSEETEDPTLITYYASAQGLNGESLLLELRSIVNTGLTRLSYGDVRYILDESDQDPNNLSNVLTIYDRQSVSGVWTGLSSSDTFNREHVWPNSRLGVASVENHHINIASDLHNLRAAIPSTNSSRSNKWYDLTTTTTTYYPGEHDKGDVARIILFMYMAYTGMEIVETITPEMENNYLPTGRYMAKFSVLLDWHLEDPVDDFERNRNNVIYSYQNNRNPFIDYPDFVESIWGSIPTSSTSASQFATPLSSSYQSYTTYSFSYR
jgi:endonuclease I